VLESYAKIRDDLMNVLTDLVRTENGANHPSLLSARSALERLEGNRFNLVVLGQFKRGKSTFLNALLGDPLLPTAVVPLTAIVTLMRYGERERIEVHFRDGRVREVTRSELADYITESGNPENRKGVDRVEVFLPAELLRDGLQLVDTPGVGSVFAHNTDVAYEFLPNADAAVFLVTGDPPISQSEREFLRHARKYVGKLFFVQNKVDHLSPSEQRESLAFTKRVIEQELGREGLPIFPLSARLALEARVAKDLQGLEASGLPDFEKALGDFLSRERGSVALGSALSAAWRVITELQLEGDLEEKALRMPLSELEERLQAFDRELATIQQEKEDDLFLARKALEKLITDTLDPDIKSCTQSLRKDLGSKLQAFCRERSHLPARKLIAEVNLFLPKLLEEHLGAWREREAEKMTMELSARLKILSGRINACVERVQELSRRIFELEVERLPETTELSHESRFYFQDWRLRVHVDALSLPLLLLMPRSWGQRFVETRARQALMLQIEMHCGQTRSDFVTRLHQSLDEYAKILDSRVTQAVEGIHAAVRMARELREKGQAEMDAALSRIRSEREHLSTLARKLEDIGRQLEGTT